MIMKVSFHQIYQNVILSFTGILLLLQNWQLAETISGIPTIDLLANENDTIRFINAGGVLTIVSYINDINGDNLSEILIGAPYADPQGRLAAGSVYIIWGNRTFPRVIDLAKWTELNAGIRFDGAIAQDELGKTITSISDINGDKLSEILIAAPNASPQQRKNAGSSYLIWGNSSLPHIVDLANWQTLNIGVRFDGAQSQDQLGSAISSIPDLDGDNISEILIAAPYANPLQRNKAGSIYLIWGDPQFRQIIDMMNWTTLNLGTRFDGAVSGDNCGIANNYLPDINGDNIPEILIGAKSASPRGRTQAGSTYLIWGTNEMPNLFDLANWNTLNLGIRFDGAAALDFSGCSVGSIADINNDTISEILIGANGASPQGKLKAGSSYLIWGNASLDKIIDLANWTNLHAGVRFDGDVQDIQSGRPLTSSLDINGDNIPEILIGAPLADATGKSLTGSGYLLWGQSTLSNVVDLANWADMRMGIKFNGGNENQYTGYSLSSLPDISGDGRPEVLLSSYPDSEASMVHLVFSDVILNVSRPSSLFTTLPTAITLSTLLETPISSPQPANSLGATTVSSNISIVNDLPSAESVPAYIYVLSVGTALLVMLSCAGAVYMILRNRLKQQSARARKLDLSITSSVEPEFFMELPLPNVEELVIPNDAIQLDEEIGRGSSSLVYRAQWQGKNVAIKRFISSDLSTAVQREFFEQALSLSKLRCPNIIILYGISVETKPYAFVLEYMAGGSLYQLLHSDDGLSWQTRIHIILDIGRGLSYLHDKQICYPNLKSSSVLLTDSNEAKLSDFSLSTIKNTTNPMTHSTEPIENFYTLAPELFTTKAQNDSTCNVYSYGIVMWEIASRTIPFKEAIGMPDIFMKWKKEGKAEARPSDTPDVVWELMEGCWSLIPEQRPTAKAVVEKLSSSVPSFAGSMKDLGWLNNKRNVASNSASESFNGEKSEKLAKISKSKHKTKKTSHLNSAKM